MKSLFRPTSLLAIALLCTCVTQAYGLGSALPIPFLSLPKLTDWGERPSELFLVPSAQFDRVTRLRPYGGSQSGSCKQSYGSFELRSKTNLITPVDGKVSEITYCGRTGTRDWLGLAVRFARYDGSPVELVIQVFPTNPKLSCSEGRERFDNGLFASWVGVREGNTIEAGTPLLKSEDSNVEVRFFLRDPEKGRVACASLFAESTVRDLLRRAPASPSRECPVLLPKKTPLCLKPAPEEDWLGAASTL